MGMVPLLRNGFLILVALLYHFCPARANIILDRAETVPSVNSTFLEFEEPCGTKLTDNERRRTQAAFEQFRQRERRQEDSNRLWIHYIDVVFQIVAANFTYEGGWIPDSQIDDQMAMLNKNYEDTGIKFRHISTNRILSPFYFDFISTDTKGVMTDLQTMFRQGDAMTLNIYTIGLSRSSQTGFSSQPVNYANSKVNDGIFIKWNSLPGGSSMERQGGTATHEAGHWLGLQHVFDGGCADGVGDGVDDTPRQARALFGCPIGSDTCPDDNGLDPIHNFMGYTDDECRREFTSGQIDLMHRTIETFRIGK